MRFTRGLYDYKSYSSRRTVQQLNLFDYLQQKQAEQEEEFIVNKLMKRLDQLKREKQVLANEVRRSRR